MAGQSNHWHSDISKNFNKGIHDHRKLTPWNVIVNGNIKQRFLATDNPKSLPVKSDAAYKTISSGFLNIHLNHPKIYSNFLYAGRYNLDMSNTMKQIYHTELVNFSFEAFQNFMYLDFSSDIAGHPIERQTKTSFISGMDDLETTVSYCNPSNGEKKI